MYYIGDYLELVYPFNIINVHVTKKEFKFISGIWTFIKLDRFKDGAILYSNGNLSDYESIKNITC